MFRTITLEGNIINVNKIIMVSKVQSYPDNQIGFDIILDNCQLTYKESIHEDDIDANMEAVRVAIIDAMNGH